MKNISSEKNVQETISVPKTPQRMIFFKNGKKFSSKVVAYLLMHDFLQLTKG